MLSELISARRKELNMSVMDLARATNLSRTYIHSLESTVPGKRVIQPTAGVLIDLARALTVSIGEVFRAAGLEVGDLPMPVDARLQQVLEWLQTDHDLARLVDVWAMLTAEDRAAVRQAAEDLAQLRAYQAEVRRVTATDTDR